jgi:GT2 family glycosyltransferase
MSSCPITAIMPTYKRKEKLLESLARVYSCEPRPEEVIVHIDNSDLESAALLENEATRFPNLKVLLSRSHLGPGASRNLLLAAASHPIVASFDDDSYPIDLDYFKRIRELFDLFPKAAMLEAEVYHIGQTIHADKFAATWVADFTGCGCAYRLDVFKQTSGYVRRVVPYGAEETDLALRLHALGYGVLKSSWLRIFHNTKLEHHENPRVNAGVVENHALIPFLRYPFRYWWLGVAQLVRQIMFLVRHNRRAGVVKGIVNIPSLLWKHRHQRSIVSGRHLLSYLRLRHNPVAVQLAPEMISSER